MLEIHGPNVSPFVRKTRVALAEKGIQYKLVPVNPFAPTPEFKAISPLGKVPVLRHESLTLPDSTCIIAYLERCFPERSLYPQDPAEYGRALFYEEYADTRVYDTLAPVFVQRVLVPMLMGGTPDQARIQSCLERAPEVLDYLEAELGDKQWLVGDRLSVADIAVASPFVNWGYAGERVDPARWPRLVAYLGRIHARPSFRALLDEEAALFGGARA
jgi:glutathione S-transferase